MSASYPIVRCGVRCRCPDLDAHRMPPCWFALTSKNVFICVAIEPCRSRKRAGGLTVPGVPPGTGPSHVVTLGPVRIEQGLAEAPAQAGELDSEDLRRGAACPRLL